MIREQKIMCSKAERENYRKHSRNNGTKASKVKFIYVYYIKYNIIQLYNIIYKVKKYIYAK